VSARARLDPARGNPGVEILLQEAQVFAYRNNRQSPGSAGFVDPARADAQVRGRLLDVPESGWGHLSGSHLELVDHPQNRRLADAISEC
jgi:hypothetical protein